MSDWLSQVQVLTALLAIVNPVGAVPIFVGLLGDAPADEQRAAARTTALTVGVILLVSMVAGTAVLAAFGVRMASFQAGGGILIVLMALSMLHAQRSGTRHTAEEAEEAAERESVAITPLGVPLLAGPGSIGAVILYAHQAATWPEYAWLGAAIGVVALAVWSVLRLATPIASAFGRIGINIVTRLMGLLLVAVGVEFIARGLAGLFPTALGGAP